MNEPTQDQIDEFLRLLTEATRKTGVEIAGCGCCGSPFIITVSGPGHYEYDPRSLGGNVEWTGDDGERMGQ